MPEAARSLLERIHPDALLWLGLSSLVTFVLGLLAVPFVVLRLPADYYLAPKRTRPPSSVPPLLRFALRLGRNALGAILVLLGVLMLVLPGQGLLTLLVGLMVMDFPGRFRLERRILSFPRVLGAINALRRRHGRDPFTLPPDRDSQS